ncbi:MAG TPA: amidase [Casimicrobiaceae bacterium]|nr:amidase [Casimicrobiaceae bacterium]
MQSNRLSASELARAIARRETTSEGAVLACLARIEERDHEVRAWAYVDRELALEQARACDRSKPRGCMHGVPIGVKDVLDTADMPTQMGSPIYAGHRPRADATCVSLLRQAGAVILGKTVTCEFAGMTAAQTRNPLDFEHTPGGSYSGSAAAVADFMVPAAFGTQTGGSVLRPAAFCGVFGFKPTFGRYSRTGLKFAAESFDTIGTIARTVEDIELIDDVLVGRRAASREAFAPPAVGVCKTHLWSTAWPETVAAIERVAKSFASAGVCVTEVTLPSAFADLTPARARINAYERAHATAYEWHRHRDAISERMRATIADGFATPPDQYWAAQAVVAQCREILAQAMTHVDVLLTPCVPGEAPRGLDHTGEPRFQELWTALYVPSISIPAGRGPCGLPTAVQLVGKAGHDEKVLAVARWISTATLE